MYVYRGEESMYVNRGGGVLRYAPEDGFACFSKGMQGAWKSDL